MPHQCVRCNTFYEENSPEVIKGCKCGAKMFFFIKKEKLERMRELTKNLDNKEREQIEEDVKEIIGNQEDDTVVLDLETIRVQEPGKYELDLVQLFKNEPLIYKIEEGKYVIDVVRSFQAIRKN